MENEQEPQTALRTMVEKLDNRRPDSNGYVAELPELKAILSELSDRVPVGVQLDQYGTGGDIVSVTIKVGFALERSLL